jgi:hypothetical protein
VYYVILQTEEEMKKLTTTKLIMLYILCLVLFNGMLFEYKLLDWHSYKFYSISGAAVFWSLLFYFLSGGSILSKKPILLKQCNYCELLVPLKSNGSDTVEHCCPKIDKPKPQFGTL